MATSIVSALTGIPIDKHIAMTGEITLRGNVLPIGGLKEKALAAHRGGIRRVLFPKENENDIEEIPATVRNELELIPVSHVDEVLYEALRCRKPDDFAALLAANAARHELLFADEKKKDEQGDREQRDEKGQSPSIVAH
jgi:predicted ATP-dependent protease